MIKAIETRYAGCRFRSRLEARWAVFFENLGVPWEYEPEGYNTPAGAYLPDFRIKLHSRTVLFEVKPDLNLDVPLECENRRGNNEIPLDARWKYFTETGLYIAYGLPRISREHSRNLFCDDGFPRSDLQTGLFRIWQHNEQEGFLFFCQCPYCLAIEISHAGSLLESTVYDEGDPMLIPQYSMICGHTLNPDQFSCCGHKYEKGGLQYHGGTKRIMRAYDTARSARFEHGERG